MQFYVMDVVIGREHCKAVRDAVQAHEPLGLWDGALSDDQAWVRVLIRSDMTQSILDQLDERYGGEASFRVTLCPIEATLPRPAAPPPAPPADEADGQPKPPRGPQISREELYHDVEGGARVDSIYIATVVLSALVAAIGLMRDDVAVIIGAMVIAPLLKPNVALGLATALGDGPLAWRALRTNAVGLATAVLAAVTVGLLLDVDPRTPAIASRSAVGIGDIALALAAGAAGAIAVTSGVPAALIGVMVAVALLPPLVVCSLHAAAGRWTDALSAGLLVVVNVTCVNLACVATFVLRGIRPRRWYEADRAKRATRAAIVGWLIALAILAVAVYFAGRLEA